MIIRTAVFGICLLVSQCDCLPSQVDADQIQLAVGRGDMVAVKALINADPDCLNANAETSYLGRPLNIAVERGNYAMVEFLLDSGADVNAPGGSSNNTPIEHARTPRMARLLAARGANLSVTSGLRNNPESLVQRAIARHEFELAETFVELGVTLDPESAVKLGMTERAETMLIEAPQTKWRLNHLLCNAAAFGRTDTCAMLIELGADPSGDCGVMNVLGPYTALSGAVRGNHLDTARFLCEQGAETNVSGGRGQDILLHHAIAFRDIEFVKLLLKHGGDVRVSRTNATGSPLHIACSLGGADGYERWLVVGQPSNPIYEQTRDKEIVKLLIEKGTLVDARNDYGATPLFLAALSNKQEICELLKENGARPDLACACLIGDLETTRALAAGEQLEQRVLGHTPLYWAIQSGNHDVVDHLLERGADPNAVTVKLSYTDGDGFAAYPNEYYQRPLLHSIAKDSTADVIKRLVERGANIQGEDARGWTPLMVAIDAANVEAVAALIELGSVLNHRGAKGESSTTLAATNTALLEILIDASTNSDQIDANSRNAALNYAAKARNFDAVALLKANGAKVVDIETACMLNEPDVIKEEIDAYHRGEVKVSSAQQRRMYKIDRHPTLIILAAEYGSVLAIEQLIQLGASTDNALHAATRRGQLVAVEFFLDRGISVDALTARQLTPLHRAAEYLQLDAARYLLDAGADVQALDDEGNTSIHKMVNLPLWEWTPEVQAGAKFKERVRELLRLLMERGADIDRQNGYGMTALHIACLYGRIDMAKALVAAGADPRIQTWEAESALDLARKTGLPNYPRLPDKHSLVEYLESIIENRTDGRGK